MAPPCRSPVADTDTRRKRARRGVGYNYLGLTRPCFWTRRDDTVCMEKALEKGGVHAADTVALQLQREGGVKEKKNLKRKPNHFFSH